MKILYLIMDGLGDRPIASMGGKTPLEAADTPCLDRLALEGMTGLMHPLRPGVPVGTDVGHICLFGYDPDRVYTGRGPIEAAGVGATMRPDELAFRGNFATVDANGLLVDKRAGRIAKGTAELAAAVSGLDLGDGVSVRVKEATEHRAAVIFSGPGLSAEVTATYPEPLDALPMPFLRSAPKNPGDPAASAFAEKVNLFTRRAHAIMDAHPVNAARRERGEKPANIMLLRSPGLMPEIQSFGARYGGIRAGLVVAQETVLALGKMMGMTIAKAPGMTGGLHTDYAVKAREALRLLETHDLVFVHVKSPDLAGHDNLPEKKKECIEQVDIMLAAVINAHPGPLIVAVGADHSTPCAFGEHSGDPVPVLLWGQGLRSDATRAYGERDAIGGGIGHISGRDFLNVVLNAAYLVPKQGA